jgi:hypothetical protein
MRLPSVVVGRDAAKLLGGDPVDSVLLDQVAKCLASNVSSMRSSASLSKITRLRTKRSSAMSYDSSMMRLISLSIWKAI